MNKRIIVLGALLLAAAGVGLWSIGNPDDRPKPKAAVATNQPAHTGDTAKSTSPAIVAPGPATTSSGQLWATAVSTQGSHLGAAATAVAGRTAYFNAPVVEALQGLSRGSKVLIPLAGDEEVSGVVNLALVDSNGAVRVGGSLTGARTGSFSLSQIGDQLSGRILLPKEGLAYLVNTEAGRMVLSELPLASLLCYPMPHEPAGQAPAAAVAGPQGAPPLLSSRPSSSTVIYLDFDGATVTDPDWNEGNTIVADASALNNNQITEVWNRVKEDFWPFDIDITTDPNRYNNASVGRRMRVVITPTSTALPGSGGVAYIGSLTLARAPYYYFNDNIPCWVFNTSVDGVAEAISHEAGHTLGLYHDGLSPARTGYSSTTGEYYYGHGDSSSAVGWAPIMGAGYYQKLVQWSKGEYPGATSNQDDVAIIAGEIPFRFTGFSTPYTNTVGFIADEAGNTNATANVIDVSSGSYSINGIISSETDDDYYTFTLTRSGPLVLNVFPPSAYTKQPNLDVLVQLQNASGTVINSANPVGAVGATIDTEVPAGTYFVRIKGTGRAGNGSTDYGYSNYGSIGAYVFGLTCPVQSPPQIITQPSNVSVSAGGTARFSVQITGGQPLTYQWLKSGVPLEDSATISGTTSSALTITDCQGPSVGTYSVRVTNSLGTVVSNTATLTVTNLPGVITPIAGFYRHGLFIKQDGALWGMGRNDNGQLGDGSTVERRNQIRIATGVAAAAAGTAHTLYIKTDGTLWGMGSNGHGELGDGSTTQRTTPVQVATNVVAVAAGDARSFFIKTDGTLWATGAGVGPASGIGSIGSDRSSPVQIATDVVAVATGDTHSVFLKGDGTAWLFAGANISIAAPTMVAGNVVAIAAGNSHSALLKADGSLWTFGNNSQAQLGDGTNISRSSPVQIATGVKAMSAGGRRIFYIKSDGTLWGAGYDHLGNGTNNISATPLLIAPDVFSVSTGGSQTSYVKPDGGLWAFGFNFNGELGDGTATERLTPVQVAGGLVSLPERVFTLDASNGVSDNYVRITWAPIIGAASYEVWRSTTTSSSEAIKVSGVVASPLYYDYTATFGVTYFYWIRAVNQAGAGAFGNSDPGFAGILRAPVIVNQPAGFTASQGGTASFTITVTGNPAPTFQWQCLAHGSDTWINLTNGGAYSGVTAASLALTGINNEMSGDRFRCVVTNSVGGVTSAAALLNVQGVPEVTVVGASRQVASAGDSLTLAVNATGTGSLSYQWIHNGRPMAGATGSTLSLAGLTSEDAGWYVVVVSDSGGSSRRSSPFFVKVMPAKTQLVAWGSYFSTRDMPFLSHDLISVAPGNRHTLALKRDGTVLAWGLNGTGQSNVPAGLGNVVAIANSNHALALKSNGTVTAWGLNDAGQRNVPSDLTDVVAVAAGGYHSVALKSDGTVRAWGYNTSGQATVPAGLSDVIAIGAGDSNTVALKADGTVVCWGNNDFNQSTVPAGLSGVVAISAGGDHTLALKADGTVVSWGGGEFGAGSPPAGLADVIAISGGAGHSIALKSDHSLVSWGSNQVGELNAPAEASPAVAVFAGYGCSMVLRDATADTVPVITEPLADVNFVEGNWISLSVGVSGPGPFRYRWTKNGDTSYDSTVPILPGRASSDWTGLWTVTVTNHIGSVTSASATITVYPAPIVANQGPARQVLSVGQPLNLQFTATGGTGPLSYQWVHNGRPIPGATGTGYTTASVGWQDGGWYVLKVTDNVGTRFSAPIFVNVAPTVTQVRAWGSNDFGVTGIPAGLNNAISVATGFGYTLALKRDGTVVGWGFNQNGQINIPNGLTNVVAVATGGYSLALKSDGTVIAWGNIPVGQATVPHWLTDVVEIAVASGQFFALRSDGTIVSWGANYDFGSDPAVPVFSGAISMSVGTYHFVAAQADGAITMWAPSGFAEGEAFDNRPVGLPGVLKLVAGGSHTLALKADGTVAGWGKNDHGQSDVPANLSGVIQVAAGGRHSLALKADGTVVGWGTSDADGTTVPANLANVFSISANTNLSVALRDASGDPVPVFTLHPANQSVNIGATATFSVLATNSPTYQWQVLRVGQSTWADVANGTGYAGAQAANLSVFGVATINHGDQYRCVATNSYGSTVSNATALAVAANRAPTASFTLSSARTTGQAITVTLTTGDLDGNLWYANLFVRAPNQGWLRIKPNGSTVGNDLKVQADDISGGGGMRTVQFTPTAAGDYQFYLWATDLPGLQADASQTITVNAPLPNRAPTASFSLSAQRTAGQAITVTLNTGDPDGNLRYANLFVRTPNLGWLRIKPDGSTTASGSSLPADDISGGGGTRTVQFTPTAAGDYQFYLWATDLAGLQADTSQTITVAAAVANRAPTASFSLSTQRTTGQAITVTLNTGDLDGNLRYANLFVRTPQGWLRIKPDGSTTASGSSLPADDISGGGGTRTVAFTPTAAGEYMFYLWATDLAGLQADISQTITVISSGPANRAPTASFTLSSERTAGEAITVTLNTADPDGNLRYANLFVRTPNQGWLRLKPDGSTTASGSSVPADDISGGGGTRTVSFTPSAAGDYLFYLWATDLAGLQADTSQTITVGGTGPANRAPTASFTLSSERTAGEAITVTLNTADPDGNLRYANLFVRTPNQGWLRVKPDGSTTASGSSVPADDISGGGGTRTVSFTPSAAGDYLFYLWATDLAGLQADTSQTITVTSSGPANRAPTASFTLSSERTAGQAITVTLNTADPDGNLRYANLFVRTPNQGWLRLKPDGSTTASGSSVQADDISGGGGTRTVSFTPSAAGEYLFYLWATDLAGLQADTSQTIIVGGTGPANRAPTASFTLSSERTAGQAITVTVNTGDPDGNLRYANLFVRTPAQVWLRIKGDGSTTTSGSSVQADDISGGGGTRTVAFTPAAAGEYLFYLWATDLPGLQVDTAQTITVAASSGGAPLAASTTSFEAWRQARFTSAELTDPAISSADAVYGDDGLNNLLKYALGLEPKQDETGALGETTATATEWTYVYPRPASVSDVIFTIEVSTDGERWTAGNGSVEKVSAAGGWELWQARYPRTESTTATFRIKVRLR